MDGHERVYFNDPSRSPPAARRRAGGRHGPVSSSWPGREPATPAFADRGGRRLSSLAAI